MTTPTERQAAFRTTIEHILKERLDAKLDVFKLLKLQIDERRLLTRKLEALDLPLAFDSVGVICRDFAEQATGGRFTPPATPPRPRPSPRSSRTPPRPAPPPAHPAG